MGCADFPETADSLYDEIRRLTPSYAGISYARIKEGTGLRWPCPTEEHPGTPVLHVGKFSRGKGLLKAIDYKPSAEYSDDEYPLTLTTGRLLQHYHTGSMTRRSKVLDGLVSSGMVEISTTDARKLKIKNGEKVKVTSRRGSIEISALVTDKIMKGIVFIPFHFVESAANVLTNDALDPVAGIPEYKICGVKVEKIAECC
jgi:formate dehydrogenase major subunit